MPERLLKEHARFGVDSCGQPLDQHPMVEDLLSIAMLFLYNPRLTTFKTAQEFTHVQNLVNPDYPLHINPYLALPQLHPPHLPHFQAVFSPVEQHDKHDLAESFLYTSALQ